MPPLQYGWAMSEKLPVGDFRWVYDLTLQDIIDFDETCGFGYFVEVDASFPNELHDYFSDFPPMPEKITAKMTPYTTQRAREMRFGVDKASKMSQVKLAPNLFPKKSYRLHIRALKCYMGLG